MRRLLLVSLAVFLAATLASLTSFGSTNALGTQEGTTGPPPAEGGDSAVASDPYSQVVDNDAPGRFKAPGWDKESSNPAGYGKDFRFVEPTERAEPARFEITIPATDYYTVYAWWAAEEGNNAATRFGVGTTSGVKWSEVNQRIDGGMWVRIGSYEMEEGERVVQIEGASQSKGRVVADAVLVARDAIVGADGQTASVVDPDALASDPADATFSARHMTGGHRNPNGRDVLRVAKRHLGTRYGNNRCRINVREDCSCHTRLVYRHFGRRFPDSPVSQWRMRAGKKIFRKSDLRVGNLVFFDLNGGGMNSHWRDHVAIWAGNGNVIHASSYFNKVVISEARYIRGFTGGKRFRLR
jgi:cell wall-associated NlpC family hydrolase